MAKPKKGEKLKISFLGIKKKCSAFLEFLFVFCSNFYIIFCCRNLCLKSVSALDSNLAKCIWIRIQSIWILKCCGYGSGRIGIILKDPGPHPEPADSDLFISTKCKENYFFSPEKSNKLSEVFKIMTSMTLEKDNSMQTDSSVNKSQKKFLIFQHL